MITRDKIISANNCGLVDSKTGNWTCYRTPTLNAAYNLGQRGIDLSDAPDVTGYRYGDAPDSYISHNYQSNISEPGLSLAAINGGRECGSAVWFCDRAKKTYTGILSATGSDDEPIILAYDAPDYD